MLDHTPLYILFNEKLRGAIKRLDWFPGRLSLLGCQQHPVLAGTQVLPALLRDAQDCFKWDLPSPKPPHEAKQLFSNPHIPSAPRFIMETFQPQDLQLLFHFPSLCRNCCLLCSGGFLPPQSPEKPHLSSLDHDQGRKRQPKPSQHHRAVRCWTRNHQHLPESRPLGCIAQG